jgi:hypothetical protein
MDREGPERVIETVNSRDRAIDTKKERDVETERQRIIQIEKQEVKQKDGETEQDRNI